MVELEEFDQFYVVVFAGVIVWGPMKKRFEDFLELMKPAMAFWEAILFDAPTTPPNLLPPKRKEKAVTVPDDLHENKTHQLKT